IKIVMERHDGSRKLKRFDLNDVADLDQIYRLILLWARNVKLNPDPPMPAELRNRQADNWRPLISIADACSPAWGMLAREAAVALSRDLNDVDLLIILLSDI